MVVQNITTKVIPARTIVYLQCRGSWRQLPEMIGRLDRIMSRTSLRAVEPASGIYYNTSNEVSIANLKWEVFYAVPTNTPELSDDKTGVGARNLPEMEVASIFHIGSYRKASSSYELLEEWIKREELRVCGPSEEVYITVFGVPIEKQTMEIRIPVSPT